MDRSVQDYLVRAHNKVIAHYRQVLRATNALTQSERAHIQNRLTHVEAELEVWEGDAASPRLARVA